MVLSYCIAAIMAFVSAMTFVEMSVDYPLAGSSFNYVLAVMGEFPAWCACPFAPMLFKQQRRGPGQSLCLLACCLL